MIRSFPWMYLLFSMDLSVPFHEPIRSFPWTYPFFSMDLSVPFPGCIRYFEWIFSVPFNSPIHSFPWKYPFLSMDLSIPVNGFIRYLSYPWILWNYPQTPWRNLFIPHPLNLSINLCYRCTFPVYLCIYLSMVNDCIITVYRLVYRIEMFVLLKRML